MSTAFVSGSSQLTSSLTTINILVPSSLAVGNLMLAFVQYNNAVSSTTITPPSGWTTQRMIPGVSGVSLPSLIAWKIADSSDQAAPYFTFTMSTAGTNGGMTGVILQYSGVDTTKPIADENYIPSPGVTNASAPSLTSDSATDREVYFAGGYYGFTPTFPADLTARTNVNGSTAGGGIYAADKTVTALKSIEGESITYSSAEYVDLEAVLLRAQVTAALSSTSSMSTTGSVTSVQSGAASLSSTSSMSAAGTVTTPSTGPTFVSASQSTGTSTVNAPTGIVAGNLLLALIYEADTTATGISAPSGWNTTSAVSLSSSVGTWWYSWKIATAAEPSTYTFTIAGDAATYQAITVLQYSGTDTSAPIGNFTDTTYSSVTTASIPSETANASGVGLALAMSYFGKAVQSRSSGLTNRVNALSAGNTMLDVNEFNSAFTKNAATPTTESVTLAASDSGHAAVLLIASPLPLTVSFASTSTLSATPSATVYQGSSALASSSTLSASGIIAQPVVAVSSAGKIASSPDDNTWTQRTTSFGTSDQIESVTFGNGLFLTGGSAGKLATSSDGTTWTQVATTNFSSSGTIYCVTYGGSKFLAAGSSGQMVTSPDATTWTSQSVTAFGTNSITSVAYGNSLYLAGGQTGVLVTSPDAITWTQRTVPLTGTIYTIAYGNSLYVAGGSNGQLATSTDGVTWTLRSTPLISTDIVLSVCYAAGQWVAGVSGGKLLTSPDGVTWTSQNSGFSGDDVDAVIYANSLWVISGSSGKISTSPNAVTWTARTSSFANTASILSLAVKSIAPISVSGSASLTATSSLSSTTPTVTGSASLSSSSSITAAGAKLIAGAAALQSNTALSTSGGTSLFGVANLVAATAGGITPSAGSSAFLSSAATILARPTYYIQNNNPVVVNVVTASGSANVDPARHIIGATATVTVPVLLGDVEFGSLPPVPGSDTAQILVYSSGGSVVFGSHNNGDFFASPIVMNEATGSVNIDPGSATLEPGEPATSDTGSIWLYLQPSTPGYLTVRGDTTKLNYSILIYQGNDLASLSYIDSVYFASGGTTLPELFETVAGGVNYYVRVTAATPGVITVDWSFDARRPQLVFQLTSPLLGANSAGVLDTTPGSLNASIVGADPNETVSFSLPDGTFIASYTADDTGVLSNVSLDIPELAAGQYNITATALTSGRTDVQVMTITNAPGAHPTLPAPDTVISTIPAASVNKWVFVNPPTGETYTLPINPNRMTSPHAPRNVFSEATTAPDGQMIMWEGARRCQPWTIEGFILDQAHYEKMEQFLALNNRIIIVDHRLRAWICSIESFEPQKIGYETNPYWAKYSLTAFIYGGGEKVTPA